MNFLLKKIRSTCSPHSLFVGYGTVGILLFLYSFTQVDLGLTLTQLSLWQTIQQGFQHIGFFERSLSSGLYIGIIIGLFVSYSAVLKNIRDHQISDRSLWALIFLVFFLLVFSFPAFSYDFFNYMFTAKTVLLYHKNPYEVIPLQFTGYESWLSFMHWTHLPSAYAPLWIVFTLFPYFFGFGYFLWILWNLKLFVGLFYIGGAWVIARLLRHESEEDRLYGIALYAFNPLILIETLISGHNDIVMVFFALIAIMFLQKKNMIVSFFWLSVSIALKEITFMLFPLYIFRKNRYLPVILMGLGLIAFLLIFKREILPWYGVWVIPFAAIMPRVKKFLPLLFGFSLGLLLYYIPFLYCGHWDEPVGVIKFWLTLTPMILACIFSIGSYMLSFQKKV